MQQRHRSQSPAARSRASMSRESRSSIDAPPAMGTGATQRESAAINFPAATAGSQSAPHLPLLLPVRAAASEDARYMQPLAPSSSASKFRQVLFAAAADSPREKRRHYTAVRARAISTAFSSTFFDFIISRRGAGLLATSIIVGVWAA